MQDADALEAERAAKMQSTLRLNLGIKDGSANVYWKHDAKIRPSSGRWDVKEIAADGREVQPQFQVLPPPSYSQLQSHPLPPTAPLQSASPSQFQTLPYPQPQPQLPVPLPHDWPAPAAAGSGGDLSATDPRVIRWVDVTMDASRTTYTAALPCSLPPTEAGRRQYLLIEVYVEVRVPYAVRKDFGLVVCPLQVKVYKPKDKNALSSFPLRFVQFDFREDSSSVGDLFAVNFYRY
ncbi:hypothetical protein VOLCADRAFT_116198 [Volvox carteri f. nagariensis]|uniref:Uncharacterized protein n=1 Tax=Volvox carteri f. nagariensis TaxID=3068 RepID=D8TJZ8_VOLCA|nr:uncharacterized protein VOLCADRAFT_116198 [Volvox carteri f. nagariensis]EFJ51976.1 hypothetical protein VOLCADRAFT_116198 [Volvox carteri f. nagariensis]|eukprot:XP_002946750.1 hypothetical protein VOLCADRAFT_116198 [Volvox carteri f. nagariensis]